VAPSATTRTRPLTLDPEALVTVHRPVSRSSWALVTYNQAGMYSNSGLGLLKLWMPKHVVHLACDAACVLLSEWHALQCISPSVPQAAGTNTHRAHILTESLPPPSSLTSKPSLSSAPALAELRATRMSRLMRFTAHAAAWELRGMPDQTCNCKFACDTHILHPSLRGCYSV
jgi:hypothetical protein